jgi:RNA polymerase sigma-32 factor
VTVKRTRAELASPSPRDADAGGSDPETVLDASRLQRRLIQALPQFQVELTPRERRIFRARVLSAQAETLAQVSAALGITAERVRQIEEELRARLRAKVGAE